MARITTTGNDIRKGDHLVSVQGDNDYANGIVTNVAYSGEADYSGVIVKAWSVRIQGREDNVTLWDDDAIEVER